MSGNKLTIKDDIRFYPVFAPEHSGVSFYWGFPAEVRLGTEDYCFVVTRYRNERSAKMIAKREGCLFLAPPPKERQSHTGHQEVRYKIYDWHRVYSSIFKFRKYIFPPFTVGTEILESQEAYVALLRGPNVRELYILEPQKHADTPAVLQSEQQEEKEIQGRLRSLGTFEVEGNPAGLFARGVLRIYNHEVHGTRWIKFPAAFVGRQGLCAIVVPEKIAVVMSNDHEAETFHEPMLLWHPTPSGDD